MQQAYRNTATEIRFREALESLKSVFGKFEKPPLESCRD
jgi:hypothetical protein